MRTVALVTDTTADLPSDVAAELDVIVVPARATFGDHGFVDGELTSQQLYARMRDSGEAPVASAPTQAQWIEAFERGLAQAGAVVCLVMPFDMIPTFTNANGARVSLRGEGTIKVVNTGAASAALCSLLVALSAGIDTGWDADRVVDAVDELAPRADVLFVPRELSWLERSGRRALIEERTGRLDDVVPIVRAGTRITGVTHAPTFDEAVRTAVERVVQRAGEDTPLVVTVDHGDDADAAALIVELVRDRFKVDRLVTTSLTPTYGSQLGPGAVGIGVCPTVS